MVESNSVFLRSTHLFLGIIFRQGFSWCDEFTAKVLTKFCKQNGHSKYFYHGGTVIDLKDYSPMTDLVVTTSQYWGMRKDGKQKELFL